MSAPSSPTAVSEAPERKAYRFSPDSKAESFNVAVLMTDGCKRAAVQTKKCHLAINEAEFTDLASGYLDWRRSLSTGFGAYFRARLRTPSAERLCLRNTKFVLGTMKLLGLDDAGDVSMSLHMLALPAVIKAVIQCSSDRKIKSTRLYQLLSEVRHMVAFVIEEACTDLTARERSQIKTASFEAVGLLNAQLKECSTDKKAESRLRASLSQDDLEAMGKVLSESERLHLCSQVETYLAKPTPERVTKDHAYAFQAHICTYLLVSNILPVVRQEILVALKIGKTLKWDDKALQYAIDCPPIGKTKTALLVLVPRSETPLLRRFINDFRPILLGEQHDHTYLFVTESGGARKEVSYLLRSVQMLYLAKAAPGHSFRHSQASLSAQIGQSEEEKKAMAASRLHSVACSDRVYTHSNRKRQAEIALSHLERVRNESAKRQHRRQELPVPPSPLEEEDQPASDAVDHLPVHVKSEPDEAAPANKRDAKAHDDSAAYWHGTAVRVKHEPRVHLKRERVWSASGSLSPAPAQPKSIGRSKRLAIVVE